MSAVPDGYRQGLLTAQTLFLGFSLAFVRFWTLEAPGEWAPRSVLAAAVVGLSIVFQLFSLFRALDVRDNEEEHYATTVRVFFIAVLTLIVGVGFSIASAN